MKKVCFALVLCLSVLFFVFGEELLTRLDEYPEPRQKNAADPSRQGTEQVLRETASRRFAGLGTQSTGLPNNAGIGAIEDWAFAYTDLSTVHIPEGVTVIGKGAFANSALSTVLLPRSLQTIDEWAFAHNNIAAVVFPENVVSIGKYAFLGNRITDVTLGSSVRLSREAIDNAFFETYNKAEHAAGHYIKKGDTWQRE
jgi:hypothetical protein